MERVDRTEPIRTLFTSEPPIVVMYSLYSFLGECLNDSCIDLSLPKQFFDNASTRATVWLIS